MYEGGGRRLDRFEAQLEIFSLKKMPYFWKSQFRIQINNKIEFEQTLEGVIARSFPLAATN